MKLFQLGIGVYQYYKKNVNGNEHISFNQAQKKLTRNLMLADKVEQKTEDKQLYLYGRLHILVKDDKIVWVRNRCRNPFGWEVDMKKYERLNRELGIDKDTKLEDVV